MLCLTTHLHSNNGKGLLLFALSRNNPIYTAAEYQAPFPASPHPHLPSMASSLSPSQPGRQLQVEWEMCPTWSPIAVATLESSGNCVTEDEPLKGLMDDEWSSLEDDPQRLLPVSCLP